MTGLQELLGIQTMLNNIDMLVLCAQVTAVATTGLLIERLVWRVQDFVSWVAYVRWRKAQMRANKGILRPVERLSLQEHINTQSTEKVA
jgi:hypothetical protein